MIAWRINVLKRSYFIIDNRKWFNFKIFFLLFKITEILFDDEKFRYEGEFKDG